MIEEALAVAGKDLDRLILVRELMSRVPARTRSNSKLPELVDLFLSRPLVTVPLAAKLLKVTPKAVDLMLAQLGGALPANSPAAPATEHGASCKAWILPRSSVCMRPYVQEIQHGLDRQLARGGKV